MRFQPALIPATLIRRYKRFLADVRLADDTTTVYCPDTGAMLGCCEPRSAIWLSRSDKPGRKYALTWELVEVRDGVLASINSSATNRLVAEAMESGLLSDLGDYTRCQPEPRVASGRLDFLLGAAGRRDCYVEVKSLTARAAGKTAMFPDAVSSRARRHLEQLTLLHQNGCRAVLLFVVKRPDLDRVRPAREIDPGYAIALEQAIAAGVEVLAWGCHVSPVEVHLERRLTFFLDR